MTHRTTPNPGSAHHARRHGGSAFLARPTEGEAPGRDVFAEALAESYVFAVTSGEQHADRTLDAFVEEEMGGPYLQQDGDVDAPPEGFPELPPSLRHELTAEPDVLAFEPLGARSANSTRRLDRQRSGAIQSK
jgi:hypothetical protein